MKRITIYAQKELFFMTTNNVHQNEFNIKARQYEYYSRKFLNQTKCCTNQVNIIKEKFFPSYSLEKNKLGWNLYDEDSNFVLGANSNMKLVKKILIHANQTFKLNPKEVLDIPDNKKNPFSYNKTNVYKLIYHDNSFEIIEAETIEQALFKRITKDNVKDWECLEINLEDKSEDTVEREHTYKIKARNRNAEYIGIGKTIEEVLDNLNMSFKDIEYWYIIKNERHTIPWDQLNIVDMKLQINEMKQQITNMIETFKGKYNTFGQFNLKYINNQIDISFNIDLNE